MPVPKILWWLAYLVFSIVLFLVLAFRITHNHLGIAEGIGESGLCYLVFFLGAAFFFSKILRKNFGVGILYALVGCILGGSICLIPGDRFIENYFLQWFLAGMTVATVSGAVVLIKDSFSDFKRSINEGFNKK